MPQRRTRNAGTGQSKEQLSREMRVSRLTLFIQQFEKEGLAVCRVFTPQCGPEADALGWVSFLSAQERMNELEAKMENMLATVDKVFKVEMMKMPPSLQNARMEDLISGESFVLFI